MSAKSRSQRSARKEKKRRKMFSLRKYNQLRMEKDGSDFIEDRLRQSSILANEPELLSLTFELNQLQLSLMGFVDQNPDCRLDNRITVNRDSERLAILITYFTTKLIPGLLTDEFTQRIAYSLKACETRLKMIGQTKSSEAALITRSLISISDKETLQDHPLILRLAIASLDRLILEFDNGDHQLTFCGLLFEILLMNEMLADFVGDEQAFEARYYDQKSAPKLIEIDLVSLPAKALYKNFDSLYVSSIIQGNDDFCQVEDQKPDCQKFISEDSQLCLELDQERLRLHASSMNSLNNSMEAVEKLCGEKIFFLAKTMDNVTNCQISN